MEIELKLKCPDISCARMVFDSEELTACRKGDVRRVRLYNEYYLLPEVLAAKRASSLRMRYVGNEGFATFKLQADDSGLFKVRHEWEVPAKDISDGVRKMMGEGLSQDIGEALLKTSPKVVALTEFDRDFVECVLDDGTGFEVCLDNGFFRNSIKMKKFCEIELELKSGSRDTLLIFAVMLSKKYNLSFEKKSKFARALALTKLLDRYSDG